MNEKNVAQKCRIILQFGSLRLLLGKYVQCGFVALHETYQFLDDS